MYLRRVAARYSRGVGRRASRPTNTLCLPDREVRVDVYFKIFFNVFSEFYDNCFVEYCNELKAQYM